jgi:ribosomal protein S18 acetylase RimI-like enzyme
MKIVVLPISEANAASFRESLDAVARERRYLAMVEAPPVDQVESFVRDNVARDIPQFVALDDQRVVGWVDIVPAQAYAITHCGSLGMGVLPGYRGQGIGRQLLETCIAKAWSNGITRIELEARADNSHAIRLYEHLGFTHEAVKHCGMRMDGEYFDTVQMSLLRREG